MRIQLPDDIISKGYKLVRAFHYEQLFYSKINNFTGTEKEFIERGLGYKYRQINKFRREVIK
jgi:hypothetical protein